MDLTLLNNQSLEVSLGDEFLEAMPEIRPMIQRYEAIKPTLVENKSFFAKTQSQHMDNSMTLHQWTPIRTIRQCLAEINKSETAIRQNLSKLQLVKAKMKKKKWEAEKSKCPYDKEILEAELLELMVGYQESQHYYAAAIRKIDNYVLQMNTVAKESGYWDEEKQEVSYTEKDFEREEPIHHIMTAFNQALNDWGSSGCIGPGNTIYLSQQGISEVDGQREIDLYMREEKIETAKQIQWFIQNENLNELEAAKKVKLDPNRRLNFLKRMADKYANHPETIIKLKGRELYNEQSMITQGDTRLKLEHDDGETHS